MKLKPLALAALFLLRTKEKGVKRDGKKEGKVAGMRAAIFLAAKTYYRRSSSGTREEGFKVSSDKRTFFPMLLH